MFGQKEKQDSDWQYVVPIPSVVDVIEFWRWLDRTFDYVQDYGHKNLSFCFAQIRMTDSHGRYSSRTPN